MKHLLAAALIAAAILVVSVSTATAATVNYACSGGPCYPMGVSGLVVGDLTYDISFSTGYYADIFPRGELFANSVEIATALTVVLTDAGARDLAFNPGSFATEFSIPFKIIGADLGITVATNPFGTWIVYPNLLGSQVGPGRYAVPTLVAPVPLPAGAWLLLSALGGLGFSGWRKRGAS